MKALIYLLSWKVPPEIVESEIWEMYKNILYVPNEKNSLWVFLIELMRWWLNSSMWAVFKILMGTVISIKIKLSLLSS